MKVFEFRQDMDLFCPWTTHDRSLERIAVSTAPGSAVADSWVPPIGDVRRIARLGVGDFPYWLDPLFSARARDGLADLLDPHGEWLPVVTTSGGEYFVYNVLTVIDCLDRARSRLARTPSGYVYGARRLEFDPDAIGDCCCFRVPEGITPSFYMTDPVVERIDALGLRGLAPIEIWDSETGAVHTGLI